MVTPGSDLLGEPYRVVDGMHYPYHVNLRTDPYAKNLFEKSRAVMKMSTPSNERGGESGVPRKRIAMACGRCRKRKIRCSGDNGDGQPCTNCANSNHSPCQFLRVSSCETHYVNGFNYDLDLSRHRQSRQANMGNPSPSSIPEENHHIYGHENMGYRTDPTSYTFRSNNPVSSRMWNPEPDNYSGNVEYALSANSSFPPSENYIVPCRPAAHHQLRSHDSAFYMSPHGTNSYAYGGTGQQSTLVFRPAGMIGQPTPHGPGTFPILDGVPAHDTSATGPERPLHQVYTSTGRRSLPSSGTEYRANSVSSSHSKTSHPSPGNHFIPATVTDHDQLFPRFESSPTSAYTAASAASVVDVKLDPEVITGGAQSSTRHQDNQELLYQYSNEVPYHNPPVVRSMGEPLVSQVSSTHRGVGSLRSTSAQGQSFLCETNDTSS